MKVAFAALIVVLLLADGLEPTLVRVSYAAMIWIAIGCGTLIYGALLAEAQTPPK